MFTQYHRIIDTLLVVSLLIVFLSCSSSQHAEQTNSNRKYTDVQRTNSNELPLLAVTYEEYLQYGSPVAYLNSSGDTIIPFGKFAYFGTDTFLHYATVIEIRNDSTFGPIVAIDHNQHVLFDVVLFDMAPDGFNDGLTRVKRNGKMGFANAFGEIVIPCQYAYAYWFEYGVAKVTYEATQHSDGDHTWIESDDWFEIDTRGIRVE